MDVDEDAQDDSFVKEALAKLSATGLEDGGALKRELEAALNEAFKHGFKKARTESP